MLASFWQSQIPVLWIAAPEPTRIPPVPAQVVLPVVLRTRELETSFVAVPLMESPPLV